MAAPLVPSPLDYIGRRAFAFYPAIRNATPNSWLLGAGSWSEVRVVNAQTGKELWISRQYIGAVSDGGDALIVGMTQHLELRAGNVVPRSHRRVIEMPLPREARTPLRRNSRASVVGIRLEKTSALHNRHLRVGIFILFVAGLLALVASASR